MKNKKSDIRSFLDIIIDIKKLYYENNNISENDFDKMSNLFSETEQIRKSEKFSSLIFLFLFFIIVIVIGAFVYTQYKEIEILNSDIDQKTQIIDKLKNSNMLLNYKLYGYYNENEDSIDFSYDLDLNPIINSKGKILSYKELHHEYDSLSSIANKLSYQIELVKDIYGIKFKNDYSPYSPQIDSAMLLLPAFRANLKYDGVNDVWHIYIPQ